MGNRVAVLNDSLTIPVGGDVTNKRMYKSKANRIKSTKYSLITFLPQNLLEQFRRIANFYFLVMTTISILIGKKQSPVSPLTSIIPLVFVISVTAMKQGYEDFLRHRADNVVNLSLVTVIRGGREMDIKCQNIVPGDLVKVARDCDVPCDLILLHSSDPADKCFVTTANLDGESNLKTLTVPRGLPKLEPDRLHTLGMIECEHPITDLYSFNGRIELNPGAGGRISAVPDLCIEENSCIPLMADNLLLRGSRVKNTDYAIGCAVYTGQSTKLALNSKLTKYKMSSSEKFINKFLVFFLILLISMVTICYFMKIYYDTLPGHELYLGANEPTAQVSQFLQDFLSFLVLFNYLIPISLYVTIEMHKFLGSLFLEWDKELYDEPTNQPMIVNTSDLNEELGQVEILFSDKTGTLTKNVMIFQECSINGKKYAQKRTGLLEDGKELPINLPDFKDDVYRFFETLSVCHTVQVGGTSDEVEDNSSNGGVITTANTNQQQQQQQQQQHQANMMMIPLPKMPQPMSPLAMEQPQQPPNYDRNEQEASIEDIYSFDEVDEDGEGEKETGSSPSMTANRRSNVPGLPNSGDSNPLLLNGSVNVVTDSVSDRLDGNVAFQNELKATINNFKNGGISPVLKSGRPLSIAAMDNFSHTMTTRPYSDFQSNKSLVIGGLPRTNSVEFKRTVSSDLVNPKMTHRRTQSYDTRQVRIVANAATLVRAPSKLSQQSSFRSMLNSRESYAAPSYTGGALVERNMSMYRKGIIDNVIQDLDYQASSPDEKALVEACAKVGFIFTGDDNDIVTVRVKKTVFRRTNKDLNAESMDSVKRVFKTDNSTVLNYTRLHVLEFTSDRKRMSVIVRDKKGQIWLFMKGAESHVLPLCDQTTRRMVSVTQEHINEFARVGLRTLAVARRKLTNQEYINFNNELTNANNSLSNRKQLVAEVQATIEKNLELLGATAVEDALQDDVKDTLVSLRSAGIKVWVLTGDKVETALNIAYSCGHIPDGATKYFITECTQIAALEQHLKIFELELSRNPEAEFALLIDGTSLALALQCCPERLRDLSIQCHAVLCCRLSPLQKCEVVQLMKTVQGNPITASIGDGANDVSMIQEADVGLGIVGKEGRQAARCADYAFTNFSMVKRVLLVHGHFFSSRLAMLVLYFFYKNLVFILVQLLFQRDNMFSSTSIYDSLFLTLYNMAYTALPVLFISLTEKQHNERQLMDCPELYQKNVQNRKLQWKFFCGWMALGVYHAVVIYYFAYAMWFSNPAILSSPHTVNFYCFGTFLIHNVVVLVNLKLWLVTTYHSYWFIFTIWFSILGFILTTFIYNLFNTSLFDGDLLHVYSNLLSAPTFWLLSLLIIVAALVPDFVIKAVQVLNVKITIMPGSRRRMAETNKRASRQSVHHHHRRPVPVFVSTINQVGTTIPPVVPMTRINEPIYENVNITQL